MPALSIPYTFVPFTKIVSAQVNSNFTAISTLLNTTKLDDDNIQNAGITRATKLKLGTASHVIINDGTGAMSSEAQLSTTRGGLGFSPNLVSGSAEYVVQAASDGLSLTLAPVPAPPPSKIFNYYNI